MQGFDLRVQVKRTENQLEAVQERKAELMKDRNRLREELKQVASRLGVPDTASHCIQRINEIEQELQTTQDTLSIVEGDRDVITEQRDVYKVERDTFKAKYEVSEADMRVVKAKLAAYQQQGLLERVLGRLPEPEPFQE